MQSELEQLLILQDRDQKIKQIQRRDEIGAAPARASRRSSSPRAPPVLEALKMKARHIEVDRKKLELDAGTRMESINRLKTQQYETRKNEEFRAMGNEIERYEKEIRAIEDQELELMDQVEKLKVEVAVEEKKTAAGRDSIARQMTDLDAKTQDARGTSAGAGEGSRGACQPDR